MGAHLATVDGVLQAHALLDEGMAGLALDGDAAVFAAGVEGVPGQSRVVNDLRAGLFLQEGCGQ
ncbi:hypothetical protein D9M71_554880 [compost metagenome]